METNKDILLDTNNELQIIDGDFVIAQADTQQVQLLLQSEKGNWRQYPLVGIGVEKQLNKKLDALEVVSLKKEITTQLENDEYKVNEITIAKNKELIIDFDRL